MSSGSPGSWQSCLPEKLKSTANGSNPLHHTQRTFNPGCNSKLIASYLIEARYNNQVLQGISPTTSIYIEMQKAREL
jgi:hypothetical protein